MVLTPHVLHADEQEGREEKRMANHLEATGLANRPVLQPEGCVTGTRRDLPRADVASTGFLSPPREDQVEEEVAFANALTEFLNHKVSFNYDALLTVLKKWTFNLPMKRAASGRHVFEAHVNRFALILQVHGTKPLDDLAQQASIRKR